MGPDKNQYIPEKGYLIPTQRFKIVHVRLGARQNLHAVIDHCNKMIGRRFDKKDEIRAYIQAHSKLGCSLRQLMT